MATTKNKSEVTFSHKGKKYVFDVDKFNAEQEWMRKKHVEALEHDPLEGLRHLITDTKV